MEDWPGIVEVFAVLDRPFREYLTSRATLLKFVPRADVGRVRPAQSRIVVQVAGWPSPAKTQNVSLSDAATESALLPDGPPILAAQHFIF